MENLVRFSESKGLNDGALKLCNLLWKSWFAFHRVKACGAIKLCNL